MFQPAMEVSLLAQKEFVQQRTPVSTQAAARTSASYPKAPVVVNGRYCTQRVTGVQRYATELVSRLEGEIDLRIPRSGRGPAGHLWEQTMLPWCCEGRLLWSPNACGPLAYARQVVTFHDLFPIEHPEWYSPAYARWYGIAMRQLAGRAMHLIAVSEYTKSRMVKLLGRAPDEITVIHNGCHVGKCAGKEEIDAAAAALHLPTRRYVLSLCSLERRKNMDLLLAAWVEAQRQLPEDLWLVLAGARPDAAVYGEQGRHAADLPRVFHTGYVPEPYLSGLYSGASLFVVPSLAEGFGLPLLEAMACGVRCLASSATSLPEVGGEAVRYFDPHDPGELARALVECASLPTVSGGYEPSLQQARRFSWDTAAVRTNQVLQRTAQTVMNVSVQVQEGVVSR